MTHQQAEPWYRALKSTQPDAYRKAIEYAEGVTLNHCLSTKAGADIEQATVILACELLDIRPSN